MEPSPHLLAELLALAALVATTIEYIEICARRRSARAAAAERAAAEDVGLRGLVRVMLTDGQPVFE
jgi:hypothetical protein